MEKIEIASRSKKNQMKKPVAMDGTPDNNKKKTKKGSRIIFIAINNSHNQQQR